MSNFSLKQNTLRGMTLVEMLFVIFLFTILMTAIMNSVNLLYRSNEITISQAYQIDSAKKGVDTLVRDLREMTFADNGAFPLAVMEDHKIAFYSDIDRDDSVEYVEFELISSTTLIKNIYNAVGKPSVYPSTPDETYTISRYVQNLVQSTSTFTYFDAQGNAADGSTPVVDIRYVKMHFIIDIDPARDPGEFILYSSAALRNLKDNL